MNTLEELSTEICHKMESLTPEGKEELQQLISNLFMQLIQVKSRFIDIDPSLKDDEADLREQAHTNLIHAYGLSEGQELYHLYETLKSYLFMKVKHGEAADWFLKHELG